jgi:hypothetical protein
MGLHSKEGLRVLERRERFPMPQEAPAREVFIGGCALRVLRSKAIGDRRSLITGKRWGRGPVTYLGGARINSNAVLAGVRSPPLRGGTSPAWMAVRGKVGDDAEGVFSEGRGLRVRMARPYGCQDISFPPDDEAKGPWPPGHTPRSSPCLPHGRAEPAPPRRGQGKRGSRKGESSEMTRNAIFSEGRTLCARVARPDASRGMASLRSSPSPRQPNPHLFSTLGRPLRYI